MTPIGITIQSRGYAALAKEASRRFRRFTGLECLTLKTEDGYFAKLNLDKLAPKRPIIFFDADLWLLRPMNIKQVVNWTAVNDPGVYHDHAFPHEDCLATGIYMPHYFNSGLIMCDLRVKTHRDVFKEARRLHRAAKRKGAYQTKDPGDQFYLNLAIHRLGTPITLLPFQYNFYMHMVKGGCFPHIPREVIGLHAAGVRLSEKMDHLKLFSKALSYPTEKMKYGALMASQRHDEMR